MKCSVFRTQSLTLSYSYFYKQTSSNTDNNARCAPKRRQAVSRNNSGSLSDASLSSHSSNASTTSTTSTTTHHHRRSRRGRRPARKAARKNKNNNHQQQHVIPELTVAEQDRYVALDCEMVGVGPTGRTSVLARVSCVDWHGNVLLDEYIQPSQTVTDYRTFVSGITPKQLECASHTFDTIRPVVAALLQDKILVGHGLKADLQVLQLQHPWYDIRDTAKYEPFMQVRFDDGILWPRKLRDLCATRPNLDIAADFQKGAHCSVLDAVAALRLYQSVRHKWEKIVEYKKSKTLQIMEQQQQQVDRSSDESSAQNSSSV